MPTTVKRLSLNEYYKGILAADRIVLGKALSLLESTLERDRSLALQLIEQLLPYAGKSYRIGITGVPGAGKSTLIEAFGKHLTSAGKKVAVLAVDPSSKLTKGSILGDKTRMEELSADPLAFIRPSPAGTTPGGIAARTRESILLCEAAGFEVLLVETVGVGQTETAVKDMVDFFLLVMLTGAGDDLQTIKKGILELADGIVINKADGDNATRAKATATDIRKTLHYFGSDAGLEVLTASALQKKGIAELWNMITNYFEQKGTEAIELNRKKQSLHWMHDTIKEKLYQNFYENADLKPLIKQLEENVFSLEKAPINAALELLKIYKSK